MISFAHYRGHIPVKPRLHALALRLLHANRQAKALTDKVESVSQMFGSGADRALLNTEVHLIFLTTTLGNLMPLTEHLPQAKLHGPSK